jgi:hypothetical protein
MNGNGSNGRNGHYPLEPTADAIGANGKVSVSRQQTHQ